MNLAIMIRMTVNLMRWRLPVFSSMYRIDKMAIVIDRFLAACPCSKYTLLDLKSGKATCRQLAGQPYTY